MSSTLVDDVIAPLISEYQNGTSSQTTNGSKQYGTEDVAGVRRHINNASVEQLSAGAAAVQATQAEKDMTFWETLKLYPTAVGWTIFFSLGVIMTAFDPQLLSNLYATPAFQRDFGYFYDGSYIISAPWQSALSMGNPVGQVVGALAAGYPMEWYGRKKTFLACVIGTTGCIFIQFFARSLFVLLIGELLGGLILGTYVIVAPSYASEVCPVALRGVVTSYINLSFVAGQLLANVVIAATSQLRSHWAYSGPFALQWIWPLIIFCGLPWAPESPWWLARKGRIEEAEDALRRLSSPDVNIKPVLAMIIETDALEREMETGSTYWDCFKQVNWRRTEISIGVYTIQVLSGIYLIGYAVYFFQLAGLPSSRAFEMGVVFLGVGFVATCLSWILLLKVGRRRIYNTGLLVLAFLQFLIGILDCIPDYSNRPGVIWAQSTIMVVWNGIYDLTIGPVCFVIICECSATKLRSKTIAIATAIQAAVGIAMTIAIPYLINPDELDLRGKCGFLFGSLCLVSACWAFFRLPETRGRTYEELDLMFERNVPTREFADYGKVL